MNSSLDQKDTLFHIQSTIHGWLTFADVKAAGLLGVNGLLAGATIQQRDEILLRIGQNPCFQALMLIVVGFIFFSGFFALRCLSPSLTGYKMAFLPWKTKNTEKPSILFYKHISNQDYETYSASLKECLSDSDKLNEHIISQIHINSGIATKKYYWVQLSAYCLMWAMLIIPVFAFFLHKPGGV